MKIVVSWPALAAPRADEADGGIGRAILGEEIAKQMT